jgi:hypothetical protein
MVSAPPVGNAADEGEVSGGWSRRDQSAWLPTCTAAGPGVSDRIDPPISTVSCTPIRHDLVIGRISSSSPIDSKVTTVSCTTIDSASIASATGPPTITSLDQENLQTEPNLQPEAEPNAPDLARASNEPDDTNAPCGESQRPTAAFPDCGTDPDRRLLSGAVLLISTILVLFCSSLLADAARRTPRAQGEVSRSAAASSPAPTLRASFDVAPTVRRPEGTVSNHRRATPWVDVAPTVRRPEGTVTNQRRATPWVDVAPQGRRPEGTVTNQPRAAPSVDIAPSVRRREGTVTNHRRATPWVDVAPQGRRPEGTVTNQPRAMRSVDIAPSVRRREGTVTNDRRATPWVDVAPQGRRPEGTVTNDRRATPWVDVAPQGRRPEGTVTNHRRATPWVDVAHSV